MPTFHRIRCSNCSGPLDLADIIPGGVSPDVGWFDSSNLFDGGYVLKLDDGTLAFLTHPGEESQLQREHGLTWESARAQGRLFSLEYKICAGCGTLLKEFHVASPCTGIDSDRSSLVFGVVVGVVLLVLRFVVGWSWIISAVGAFLLIAVLTVLIDVVRERFALARWDKEIEAQKIRRCPSCAHDRVLTLFEAAEETLPCPQCKTRSVTCECTGIS